jgi:hypothetical protein
MLQISELELYISFFSFFFFLVLLDSLYRLAIYWLLVSAALCLCGFFTKKVKNWHCFFSFQISKQEMNFELQEFESINPSLFIWIGNRNHDLTNILDIWSRINRLGSSCLLR